MTKSLFSQASPLAKGEEQIRILNEGSPKLRTLTPFGKKLEPLGLFPLKRTSLEIFQVNVGKMCNQVCKHCHVDAGPDRREIMTRETMLQCLKALKESSAHTVDLTGGAPEMNPDFRWFVEEIRKLDKKVIVRCNLTIILANPSYYDLPEFFKKYQVQVVSSLPYYDKRNTDRQRGDGVFDKSIKALQMLNEVGYGKGGTGLQLDLVYNPTGAFLPGAQEELEADFKRELKTLFGIEFNQLFVITNMPISRFLEYLEQSGNLESYLEKLIAAFNPQAAKGVMCRNTVSIGWDGYVYDCDFNQQLDLPVLSQTQRRLHVAEINWKAFSEETIIINQHCFGCTAGSGSSCGGSLVE
ncbi:radical SAM/Cys-rich domain protein [bacterium]|nr:radical SAM/Cys-rich domain protein [bacterium]